jgi:MFS family permease
MASIRSTPFTPTPGNPTTPVPKALQQRIVATIFASQSLFSAAQIAMFAMLPIIAVRLGGGEAFAGFPSTLSLLGQAAAAYPLGWLMDRYGRRIGLSLGLLIAICGAIISLISIGRVSFLGFCIGVMISGAGRAAGDQSRYAAAEVFPTDKRAKAIGTIVFAGTFGAIVGPLLLIPSSTLAVRYGLDAQTGPFMAYIALAYIAFMILFLFLRPDPMLLGKAVAANAAGTGATPVEVARLLRTIFRDRRVQLATCSMIIGQLVMTAIMVITPVYMDHQLYTTQDLSWVFMAHTLGMFGLSSVTGWLIDRMGPVLMITAGALTLVLSALLAPLAANLFLLILALFLLGLGWNFCFIAGSSLLSSALRTVERGRVQGANDTLVALSSGLGSLSTGSIYALGGITANSIFALTFCALLLAAIFWLGRPQSLRVPLSGR